MPQVYAIKSPHKPVLLPDFNRFGIAEFMQSDIRLLHFPGDPGSFLSGPVNGFAMVYDLCEMFVEADSEVCVFKYFFHTFRYLQILGKKHHPFGRAIPDNGFAFIKPGEDTAFVSQDQPFGRKIAANGQQAIFIRCFNGRKQYFFSENMHDQKQKTAKRKKFIFAVLSIYKQKYIKMVNRRGLRHCMNPWLQIYLLIQLVAQYRRPGFVLFLSSSPGSS